MKKTIFLTLACLYYIGHALAANTLTVGEVSIPKGGQGTIVVSCSFDKECTAFSIDMDLPDGLTIETASMSLAGSSDHTAECSLLSNGNYRFTAYSSNNEALPNNGTLFSVTVTANASLAIGENLNGQLKEIEFTPMESRDPLNMSNVAFTLAIVDPRVVLDETSLTVPAASNGAVDVRVKRTIKANEWSTLVLPFDMTEAQVKSVFGDDVELAEFIDYEANDDLTEITINFDAALLAEDGLMANNPYVIKTSKDITEFTVDGVTIDPNEEGAKVEYTNGRTGARKVVYAFFQGTYHAGTIVPKNDLFLSENKFWYSTGETKMKAFRAYFWLQDVLAGVDDGGASHAPILFNINDGGVATGIRSLNSAPIGSTVYDLSGRKVSGKLKDGVYIVDGKKKVIK